jgi:hypothetical protein
MYSRFVPPTSMLARPFFSPAALPHPALGSAAVGALVLPPLPEPAVVEPPLALTVPPWPALATPPWPALTTPPELWPATPELTAPPCPLALEGAPLELAPGELAPVELAPVAPAVGAPLVPLVIPAPPPASGLVLEHALTSDITDTSSACTTS